MASNGCFIAVLIARTYGHIPLCLYVDENFRDSDVVRKQSQMILERMETPASRPDRKMARGCHYQSFDHKDCVYFAFQDAASELTIITALNRLLLRNSGDINGMNKLACNLLDMVFAEFTTAYHINEYNAAGVRPYQFIKFESTIQKCITRAVQEDRASKDSVTLGNSGAGGGGARRQVDAHYESIRQELTDVHMVMRKNLEDLMKRGEKLETMNSYSAQLVDESSQYYKKTVRLNRMRLVRMYGPPAVVCTVLLLFLYIYLF